jgi:hypothetical protein
LVKEDRRAEACDGGSEVSLCGRSSASARDMISSQGARGLMCFRGFPCATFLFGHLGGDAIFGVNRETRQLT